MLATGGDLHRRRRSLQPRISRYVAVVIHQHAYGGAIATEKFASPVVNRQAVLTAAAGKIELQRSRIKEKASVADRSRRQVFVDDASDFGTRVARASVKTVVEAPT